MKKKNENHQKAMLLSDDPVSEDQFAGRAHERVSRGLYSIITSNGDGGYAIGLEGSWGSGKSSVITMLENEFLCKDDSDIICFTFDCWAHIGDPMKRSFLESLVNFLKYKKLISDKIIKQLLNRIRVRETVINITKKPFVPKYIYQLAVYVVVLPFLIILISSLLSAEIYLLWWDFSVINFILAIALIGFGIWYPISISKKEYKRRKESEDKNLRDQPVLPIFSFERELTQSQDFTQTESGDKTSIEFNEIFVEILGKIGEKKLVIVLDNLDRLEDEDVREIWGSLRNFFTSNKDPQNHLAKALQNVILVVPYDRKIILQAFHKEKNHNDIDDNNTPANNPGFIEKTFKTIIRVPEPIITDWKKFLDQELTTKAFEGLHINEGLLHDIFRYFDIYFTSSGNNISPRSIKFLINEMVVLYYQWGDDIPLKYIALYITIRKKIESDNILNPEKFLSNELYSEFSDDKDWYKYVIALQYNIVPEKVMHLVLSKKIIETVSSSDDRGLEELKKYDGIFVIFEKAITDKNFNSNFRDVPEKLLKFIIGTKEFAVPPQFIKRPREILFRQIIEITKSSDDKLFLLKSNILSKGIISLVDLYETNEEKSKKLISLLNAITPKKVDLSTDDSGKTTITTLSSYWTLMEEAIDYLRNCFGDTKDFKASIKKVKLPEIDWKFPLITTKNLYKCWEKYDINLLSFDQDYLLEDLISFLEDEFSNDTFDEEIIEVTKHLLQIDTDTSRNHIDSLLDILTKKIKEFAGGNTNQENYGRLAILLKTLFAIEEILSGKTVESIKELDKTRTFHKALRFNNIKNDQSLFPKIFFNLLVHGRISLNTTDTRRHQNLISISRFISDLLNGKALEEDMFNELVNLAISNYQSVILPLPTKYPNKNPLFSEIARAVVLSGKLTIQSIGYLIKQYNKYPLMQEEEVRFVFFECVRKVGEKVIESLHIKDIPISLLTDLENEKPEAFKLMVKHLKEKLNLFSANEWELIFEAKGEELKYLKFLSEEKFLDKGFKDQLLMVFRRAIKNEELSVTEEKILRDYPKLLKKKVELDLYKQAQADLIKSYHTNWRFASKLIGFTGKDILKPYPPISDDQANSYLKNLVSPFITDDIFALSWVEFNIKNIKAFFNKAKNDVKEDLHEDLILLYHNIMDRNDLNDKDELLDQLKKLAKALVVELIEGK